MSEPHEYSHLARLGWLLVMMGALVELRCSPHEPPTLKIFRRQGEWVPIRAEMRAGEPVYLVRKPNTKPPQWKPVEVRSRTAAVQVRNLVRATAVEES
ncbi:hypothetical protein [Spongiactinospora rosea]|uniref:hypothetical protein n=1 Tax=Spongiactinospora rosea TaxID=2248750 RepID=UPI0013147B16|nr:hypothetical protein [Spongiactinospora rosea]